MNECNEQTGCPLPSGVTQHNKQDAPNKSSTQHQVIFVTDPICSHCWAIEPAWRRLLLEYNIQTRYIHGGLLPGWEGFADSGNAISKPTDVIPHWHHVAQISGQPIEPSVWAKDPLSNSYILCKAAIAIRLIKPEMESAFVRKMRELVFMEAVNIAQESVLIECAQAVGVDKDSFMAILHCDQVNKIFVQEQQQMVMLGARGFPSLIFLGEQPLVLSGSRPFQQLEAALLRNAGDSIEKCHLTNEQKLAGFATWTLTEACEVLQMDQGSAQACLVKFGFIETDTAAGKLWRLK